MQKDTKNVRQEKDMFRILHLSDIHIGKTYKEPESIACKIASDIDFNGLSYINCIIVTGDIFDGQIDVTDSLIGTAIDFFKILIREINSNQEENKIDKEDIIFVPGNHDMVREDDLEKRWVKYHDFLEGFYGNIPPFYNIDNYSLFRKYEDYKIAFVGFNSCEIEKRNLFDDNYIDKFEMYINGEKLNEHGIDKAKVIEVMKSEIANEYDDYGYIPLSQITSVERKVKKLDDYIVVALFHHHFYLFPEVAKDFGDSSLIRNYAEVIQHLRYMNVSVVLHGHKHFALERPFIMDEYYESAENIIDVFAGGSVGTSRKEEHTFGVLDLYDKNADIKLEHNKFIYHGENLEPIVKKQVPPQKLSGRVVKLLDILKTMNPEKYNLYLDTAEKAFKSYDSCNKIISWVSEAITGFTEVYNYLDKDYNNILFLLYAINYRTICYMKIVGNEESYFESSSNVWQSFYDEVLQKTNFTISTFEYHQLFMYKKLKDATPHCDRLLNSCDNKKSQVYLAFTMLGMFFADLYLVLTKYADDFKKSIKYKVNVKIEENKFHENVPAPRIVVKSDADRRSAYIDLLCNEATAHKMAVLFIKEFDLLINKFEDYFKIIGLKLYYLLPRIDKDRMKNTLDNYNFEAYIPTLIPLLTGDNIYSSKVVFARELIQNSIDAISVREAKDSKEFSKKILIELKVDENKKRYFKIVDRGTGMDRYKIERYFTSIGRSFYSGEEYEDLNISYKPISNFGIGFLSSFMVCQEIDVETKYYIHDSEGLKLHIPNYDGCFFIELDKDVHVGTELKLYLDNSISDKSIIDYIRKVMQDIKYPIEIVYLDEKKGETHISVQDHSIRRQNELEEFKFFVPFLENGDIGEINYLEDIYSNKYIEKYEYGLFISKTKDFIAESKSMVLNSGIAVEQTSLREIFEDNFRINEHWYYPTEAGSYNDIIANFPANWLQLDVARENVTGFSNIINDNKSKKMSSLLANKIAESLYCQLVQYIQYSEKRKTNIPAIYLQDAINFALGFCENQQSKNQLRAKLVELRYLLSVEFSPEGLRYRIERTGLQDKRIKIMYTNSNARKLRNIWTNKLNRKRKDDFSIEQSMFKTNIGKYGREIFHIFYMVMQKKGVYGNNEIRYRIDYLLREMPQKLKMVGEIRDMLIVLTLLLLNSSDNALFNLSEEFMESVVLLETILLHHFCIGSEEMQEIYITYDELLEIAP